MGMCASRARQSPVDFPAGTLEVAEGLEAPGGNTMTFRYSPITEPFELQNNGRTYSAALSGNGYGGIAHEDAWYDVMNVNVHAVSEHTIAGQHAPAELHIVHKRFDGDALLVVAVALASPGATSASPSLVQQELRDSSGHVQSSGAFLSRKVSLSSSKRSYMPPPEVDPGFSDLVQSFLRTPLPELHASTKTLVDEDRPLDLNKFLLNASFYEYAGSMTAPPCAETVIWLVRTQPIQASVEQVRAFVDGIYAATNGQGNYRAVMPLNDRNIFVRKAMYEDPPLPPAVEGAAAVSTTIDPYAQASNIAKEALRVANRASKHVKEVDEQLKVDPEASAGLVPCSKAFQKAAIEDAVADVTKELVAAANQSAKEAAAVAVQAVKQALLAPAGQVKA